MLNNIAYAAPPERRSPEKVKALCRDITVDEFINTLPQGYDTMLRADSGGLSQGQKQLMSIARTFLCDPPVFILDEATSSVDTLTERHIQRVTANVTRGKTSIIIAHRLSTIRGADRIIVMKDGRIREVGSHDELIARTVCTPTSTAVSLLRLRDCSYGARGNGIRALSFDMGILRAEVEKRRLQWYHDVYEIAYRPGIRRA